ncbi:MAG: hypothetical protein AAFO62_07705 [Pseudomonadota bacterium]
MMLAPTPSLFAMIWIAAFLLPATFLLVALPVRAMLAPRASRSQREVLAGYGRRAKREQLATLEDGRWQTERPPLTPRPIASLLAAASVYFAWVIILGLVGTSVVVAG